MKYIGGEMTKVGIFIQARNKSTRLPDKIKLPFGQSTVLQTIIDTCKKVNPLPKAIECLVEVISSQEDPVDNSYISPTPVNDLVARYNDAMKHFEVESFIRITADCPLLHESLISTVVVQLMTADYVSNINPRTFVDGNDVQGISNKAMAWLQEHSTSREHLFYDLDFDVVFAKKFEDQGFTINRIINNAPVILNPYHPNNKFSIDTKEDYNRCLKALENKA